MPQAKTNVALQFSECCAAETALQHWLFCTAEVIWTKSCAAANEKLHCNIEKAALQESGAFLPLSCGFQAPTFRHPRLGPAEIQKILVSVKFLSAILGPEMGASILWTPGKCVLSAGKTHVHKIPRFRGGGYFGSGGGSADFIFMGARIFLTFALFCVLVFALFCALVPSSTCFCIRPRLERLRVGFSHLSSMHFGPPFMAYAELVLRR